MRVLLLGSMFTLLLTTVAVAQPSKAADVNKMAKDDCAKARAANKTCVLSFDGDTFEGNSPTGDGHGVTTIPFGRSGSLIRLRKDFIREIIKSAEDL